jgi:hypothetical protein
MGFRINNTQQIILNEAEILSGLNVSESDQNIYVSLTGNDENVGSSLSPVRTINKAFTLLENFVRYTIIVLPGVYENDMNAEECLVPAGNYSMYFMTGATVSNQNQAGAGPTPGADIGVTITDGSLSIYGKGSFIAQGGGYAMVNLSDNGFLQIYGASVIFNQAFEPNLANPAIRNVTTVQNVEQIYSDARAIDLPPYGADVQGIPSIFYFKNIQSIRSALGACIDIQIGAGILQEVSVILENIDLMVQRTNPLDNSSAINCRSRSTDPGSYVLYVNNCWIQAIELSPGFGAIQVFDATPTSPDLWTININNSTILSSRDGIIFPAGNSGNRATITNSIINAVGVGSLVSASATLNVSGSNVDGTPAVTNHGSTIDAGIAITPKPQS